jgi:hypothetical protein
MQISIVEILFAILQKRSVLWLHLNELRQGTSTLKNFLAILEAFDISINYCFSTKLKILNHKNGSFYLKIYCNAIVTLNLPINQQLVHFCNILDKNEFTADILFCCQ